MNRKRSVSTEHVDATPPLVEKNSILRDKSEKRKDAVMRVLVDDNHSPEPFTMPHQQEGSSTQMYNSSFITKSSPYKAVDQMPTERRTTIAQQTTVSNPTYYSNKSYPTQPKILMRPSVSTNSTANRTQEYSTNTLRTKVLEGPTPKIFIEKTDKSEKTPVKKTKIKPQFTELINKKWREALLKQQVLSSTSKAKPTLNVVHQRTSPLTTKASRPSRGRKL